MPNKIHQTRHPEPRSIIPFSLLFCHFGLCLRYRAPSLPESLENLIIMCFEGRVELWSKRKLLWERMSHAVPYNHTPTHRHTKTVAGVTARRNFKWKDWWPQPWLCVRMVWNNVAGSGRRGWACAHSLHSEAQPHLSCSLLHVAVPQCARLSKAS